MGAMSTMNVSRSDALKALANIEMATLTDEQVAERLNEALRDGGYSLDEVSISYGSSDDDDLERLERMVDTIAS